MEEHLGKKIKENRVRIVTEAPRTPRTEKNKSEISVRMHQIHTFTVRVATEIGGTAYEEKTKQNKINQIISNVEKGGKA